MRSLDVHRGNELTPGQGLMLLWIFEAMIVVVVASTILTPLDAMTGRRRAVDGVPPGNWFLVHPRVERTLDAIVVHSSEPMAQWLQQSSDPAYCCWRRWNVRRAAPGFDSEQDCRRALEAFRQRRRAPLALRDISASADFALANARCVHATALWTPVEGDADEDER